MEPQLDLDSASELPSTFQPHILLAWGEWPTVSEVFEPVANEDKKKKKKRKPACVSKREEAGVQAVLLAALDTHTQSFNMRCINTAVRRAYQGTFT